MDRQKIEIANPCPEDFDEMEGEGARRFCDSCQKNVHNLSDMTRSEALRLIRENGADGMCVVYTYDRENRVRFRHEGGFRRPPKSQLSGLKRLVAAAALVPILATLPACDTAPFEDPAVIEQPCDVDQETFKPVDEIIDAEERFVAEIREFLGYPPEIEPVMVAGAVAPPDYPPEQIVQEPVEPVLPPPAEEMVMGDMAAPEDVIRDLERDLEPVH